MKVTPLDIQQQQFRVRVRGFDMVEVDNFLDVMANEIEELLRENNRLKEEERQKTEKIQKMERAERELRSVFISAQQIYEEMKNSARKEGDLIIEGAKSTARKILETAQAHAMQVETEVAPLKRQRAEFKAALKGILEIHLKLVDAHPGNPMSPSGPKAE
jgi:cell division initiation protein